MVERRSSIRGIIDLVDRRRPSLSCSERPPFSAKLITCFDDRYAVAKFSKSRDKVPGGSALIFGDNRISFWHSVGRVQGSSHAKNQLDSFSRFDRTPTCDRRIDTDGHRPTASTADA